MMAYNSNTMWNSIPIKDVGRSYAWYYCCMPSSPVLLHIYSPCFSEFWHCHSYILPHFNEILLLHLFHCFFIVYNYKFFAYCECFCFAIVDIYTIVNTALVDHVTKLICNQWGNDIWGNGVWLYRSTHKSLSFSSKRDPTTILLA